MDNSDGLTSSRDIDKFTADTVREAKVYSDYIKNSDFETMNIFEQENNSGTGLNQNSSRINPDS